MPTPLDSLAFPNSEVVLAFVSPVGADLTSLEKALKDRLELFNYCVNPIRLSSLLKQLKLDTQLIFSPEGERLNSHMSAGNEVRKKADRGDSLALMAARAIGQERPLEQRVRARTAHVLLTLKHPAEVTALRRIYGPGFFLIGVCATEEERRHYLESTKGIAKGIVDQLLQRDEDEGDPLGQRTRDTFHLADVFVSLGENKPLERFLDLVFGHPFHTPNPDEYAMYLAFGASLRSGDLSRQVGAVVVSAGGEVVATGANDVPCPKGGLYWEGADDERDHKKGYDANAHHSQQIILDVMRRLRTDLAEKSNEEVLEEAKSLLGGSPRSRLLDITEFGRAVHAEMEALLSCARSGISPKGGTLYTTTFPCHNCAKHIVAAGISRVVYLEPYPKSQASDLHSDAILIANSSFADIPDPNQKKVIFSPFEGIGPRRYFDLFSVGLSSGYEVVRKKQGSKYKIEWSRSTANLRVPMVPTAYFEREDLAAREIVEETEEMQ